MALTCKRLWKYRTGGATLRTLASSTAPPTEAPPHLADILRALPQGELDGLIARLGIRIDPAKRIDVSSQVARALVSLPELRDPSRLHPASLELLHRVAEAGGKLVVSSVPPPLEPLLARGLMFARTVAAGVELILPAAYLVQLKTWEGEDPQELASAPAANPVRDDERDRGPLPRTPGDAPHRLVARAGLGRRREPTSPGGGDRSAVADRAARARGGRSRRRRGGHRGAPGTGARAPAPAHRDRRHALAPGRRILPRTARASHPHTPEPAHRSHRSERDHRRRPSQRARDEAGAGARVRRLRRSRAAAGPILSRPHAACDGARRRRTRVGRSARRRPVAVGHFRRPPLGRRHTEVARPEARDALRP